MKVDLILHSTEALDRGGPSSRVPLLEKALRNKGLDAEIKSISDSASGPLPDLAHIFNIWPPQEAVTSVRACKNRGIPVIFSPIFLDLSKRELFEQTVPGIYKSYQGNQAAKKLNDLYNSVSHDGSDLKLIEPFPHYFEFVKEACELSDSIICLSENEKNLLTQIAPNVASKICTIRNPVTTRFVNESFNKAAVLDRIGTAAYILHIGRIEPRKNQALTALACRRLGLNGVFVGDIGNIDYLNITNDVGGYNAIFTGRIDNKSPYFQDLLLGAEAVVLPSWAEGAPLAAIEAASVGQNLILSDQSSEKEYFGDFATYVHPCDILKYERLLGSANTREFDSKGLRELCRTQFSMDHHVDNTIAEYMITIGRATL